MVQLKISNYKLWMQCRYNALDNEMPRAFEQRHDSAQFAARMRRTRWCKCREEMLARPATSVRKGLSLDTREVRIHMAGGEDVRLMPDKDTRERVYMPTTLTLFWTAHRAMWAVHIRQHQQLIEAVIVVVQEYKRRGLSGLGYGSAEETAMGGGARPHGSGRRASW